VQVLRVIQEAVVSPDFRIAELSEPARFRDVAETPIRDSHADNAPQFPRGRQDAHES